MGAWVTSAALQALAVFQACVLLAQAPPWTSGRAFALWWWVIVKDGDGCPFHQFNVEILVQKPSRRLDNRHPQRWCQCSIGDQSPINRPLEGNQRPPTYPLRQQIPGSGKEHASPPTDVASPWAAPMVWGARRARVARAAAQRGRCGSLAQRVLLLDTKKG